ncbi:MAG: hypothetical protein K2K44_13195, partial [Oscillospiraceae bacterium]|nr:hypothetical protein [Oscillospiraceae bacterium]
KEKVFSRLYAETEDIPQEETSLIEIKKGGETRLRITSFVAAAAMIAMALIIGKLVFNVDISTNLPGDESETTSQVVEIPENTALVTLRVVDENGVPVKNMRIDYLPVIVTKQDTTMSEDWYGVSYTFDMDNFDKGGTVPITYGRDEGLLIPYGDYCFNASDAMPNAEYDMFYIEQFNRIGFVDETGGSSSIVIVDESTEEIVLTVWGGNNPYEYNYPKLGVILQDSQGNPLPDYTVILKPKDGIMQEGYTDEYGGYVLTRTDENGEAFWRGNPISGEYEVIAYKEELHPADEPILEPFVFDGDNTFSYVQNDTVIINDKVFKMAE